MTFSFGIFFLSSLTLRLGKLTKTVWFLGVGVGDSYTLSYVVLFHEFLKLLLSKVSFQILNRLFFNFTIHHLWLHFLFKNSWRLPWNLSLLWLQSTIKQLWSPRQQAALRLWVWKSVKSNRSHIDLKLWTHTLCFVFWGDERNNSNFLCRC